jgi:hypothetical protein
MEQFDQHSTGRLIFGSITLCFASNRLINLQTVI